MSVALGQGTGGETGTLLQLVFFIALSLLHHCLSLSLPHSPVPIPTLTPCRLAARRAAINTTINKKCPPATQVFVYARTGRVKLVEEAIKSGFDVDFEDDLGNTILIVGGIFGQKRIVDLALARGGNINHQNVDGNTVLHYVMDRKYRMRADPDGSFSAYLMAHGSHDGIKNRFGMEPKDGTGAPRLAYA